MDNTIINQYYDLQSPLLQGLHWNIGVCHLLLLFVSNEAINFLNFEFKSFIGRMFSGKLKLDMRQRNYINLGCGSNIKDNFINIDFYFKV